LAFFLRGELLSVTLPGGTLIEYVHDPLGRRIAKKINGTVVEKYLWQGLTRLLAVYNADNTLKMRFEYADARMPVSMTKGGATYYFAYDQVGTLKAVADASGNVIKKIEYDTFGNIISDSNPAFAVPFGFAGGLYDRDTGLVRFGYRDYDPETGRWTAKDPILFAGGDTDLYGYCVNDPVNFIDPNGLIKWGAVLTGVVAVSAGVSSAASAVIISSSGSGAVVGVPLLLTSVATASWGISEIIAGFADNEINIPQPTEAALTTLILTGDVNRANQVGVMAGSATLGVSISSYVTKIPNAMEVFNCGAEFTHTAIQGESADWNVPNKK
jgi:RHS repeat-associated protein